MTRSRFAPPLPSWPPGYERGYKVPPDGARGPSALESAMARRENNARDAAAPLPDAGPFADPSRGASDPDARNRHDHDSELAREGRLLARTALGIVLLGVLLAALVRRAPRADASGEGVGPAPSTRSSRGYGGEEGTPLTKRSLLDRDMD